MPDEAEEVLKSPECRRGVTNDATRTEAPGTSPGPHHDDAELPTTTLDRGGDKAATRPTATDITYVQPHVIGSTDTHVQSVPCRHSATQSRQP